MPQYSYIAMDGNGREQRGKINAASEEIVSNQLKSKGLFPTQIKLIESEAVKKAATAAAKKKKKKKTQLNVKEQNTINRTPCCR